MKICKDCFYCEVPVRPNSRCNHPNAHFKTGGGYTNKVTGIKTPAEYIDLTCQEMRYYCYIDGFCGAKGGLFEAIADMTDEALAAKSVNILTRIKGFFK